LPALKVRSADSYPLHQEKNGLLIAAHAIVDEREMDDAFGVDLFRKGIAPIRVVVEDRSSSTTFVLDRRNIEAGVYVPGQVGRVTEGLGSSVGGEVSTAAGAFVLTPLLFAGIKMMSDATVVAHNVGDKQFYSRTLDPGQRAQGIVYFQLPGAPTNTYELIVRAVDPDSLESFLFTFNMNLRRP